MAKVSYLEGAVRTASIRAFIATPTYTGKVDNSYMFSLLQSIRKLDAAGICFDHYLLSYNCHVDDGRNAIVRDFLLSDCTDLVFIDADVAWQADDLVRLIKHDRDVVAGVYPKRASHDLDFPVWVEPGTILQADDDGLVEVSGAPTGFMKIKRHVLEKLVKANEHRQYIGKGSNSGNDPYTVVFERDIADGHRWSGDYNFCRIWRKAGGKVFVDPEMFLSHIGEVDFSGTLGDHWRDKHGVTEKIREARFNEAVNNLKSGIVDESTFADICTGWANPFSVNADLLAACYYLAKEADPKRGAILETGSGLTTLVMALANPNIQIHALEHEAIWGSRLKYFLDMHDIKNVTVHFNPLKQYGVDKWYDTTTLPKENFSLALCDGPPRKISNRNLLFSQLGEQIKDAVILQDDADSDPAVEPFKEWAKELGREVKILGKRRHFAISPPAVSQ